jgi:tetratricopeptide (TPR) repeat protein
VALVALVVAAYAPSLRGGFVWDDRLTIVQNPDVRALSSLGRVVTSADQLQASNPTPYYRPLSRLLFTLDYQAWGLNPIGYRAESLALHAAAVVLLFVLARKLIGSPGPAFVAAALLAVHPVNVEAVAFVTARNNLLVGVFVLGATLAWIRARERDSAALAVVAAALYLLGLLSKETALMFLPFVVLWEGGSLLRSSRERRRVAGMLAPLVVATAAYLVARWAVLPSGAIPRARDGDVLAGLGRLVRAVPVYARLLILPRGLTILHPDPSGVPVASWAVACTWLALVVGGGLLIRQRRSASIFGLLWLAVNFVPASSLIPIPSAPIAERYMYVPAIGLWVVAGDQLQALRGRAWARPWLPWVAACALATLAAGTLERSRDWTDDLRLQSSAVRVDPASAAARYNLGLVLLEKGDADGARREWETALSVDPRHVGAMSQLGVWHAARGDLEAARTYFSGVLDVSPADVEASFNMGLLLERLGRPEEAMRQYEAFLGLDPVDYPELIGRVKERVTSLRNRAGHRVP